MCNLIISQSEEVPSIIAQPAATAVSREWPPADSERLREMWAQGATGSEIGKELGRSRNAVIGRANRMGLDPRGRGWPTPEQQKARARRRTGLVQARMKPEPVVVALVAQPISLATTTLPETLAAAQQAMVEVCGVPDPIDGTPLEELRGMPGADRAQCRWPLNSVKRGGEYLFCRETAVKGSSYCDCHTQKAWAKYRVEVA